MKPKGQDTADAIRDWVKKDIKEGPSSRNKLGQFFFSVSTGTIGLFIGIKSFIPNNSLDTPLIISLIFLFVSSIIALYMACPFILKLTGEIDLFELYNMQIKKIKYLTITWFILWTIGILPGIYSVFISSKTYQIEKSRDSNIIINNY